MPSLATLKLIGYGVGALAVVALIVMVLGWRTERNHLRDWQSEVVAATREASANPKLDKKNVAQQIQFLGKAITDLKTGIARQNAAVTALSVESKREQDQATKAVLNAQGRAREAQTTSERLSASSRAGEAVAKPCEASKALKGAWR